MTCPNCNHEFQGDRCPNCGRPVSNTANRVAAIVILVMLVLPAALVGACSAFGGISTIGTRDGGGGFSILLLIIAACAIAACVGFGFLVGKLWRG